MSMTSDTPDIGPSFEPTLGDRLQKARRYAKLKQIDVAKHFHVSISAVSAWENGATAGRSHDLLEIIQGYADLTGVAPERLAGFRTGSSATVSQQVSDWMTTESGGSSDSLAQVIPFPIR